MPSRNRAVIRRTRVRHLGPDRPEASPASLDNPANERLAAKPPVAEYGTATVARYFREAPSVRSLSEAEGVHPPFHPRAVELPVVASCSNEQPVFPVG